jgi:hypothetical protein
MFTINLKLHPASTMVDQAETKEEASYGALDETTNERKVTQGIKAFRKKDFRSNNENK